jgi:hypothetical protein
MRRALDFAQQSADEDEEETWDKSMEDWASRNSEGKNLQYPSGFGMNGTQ